MADTKIKKEKNMVDKKSVKSETKTVVKKAKTTVKAQKTMEKVTKKVEAKVVKSGDNKNTEKTISLKAFVFGIDGLSKGSISLPSEIFGVKPNKPLLAQAVRVYLANQRQGNASTKTRSEVKGSTRKIYRQKGTGRARHGALKAPIFVGGGIAHGPKPHSFAMDFPKKMRIQALISALSQKAQEGHIKVVEGEFSGKTKEIAKLLKGMELVNKGIVSKTLFVIDDNNNAVRASHNISNLLLANSLTLSTYEVLSNKNIIFMKNSVEKIKERLTKN